MIISDRKYRKWTDTCDHEYASGKVCNRITDEETGFCKLKHGRSLHSCATKCCIIWVAGNHKFCPGHRKNKVGSICKTTDKILRRWRSLMWGKLSKTISLDNPESKKEFNEWGQKLIEKTYDFT